MPTSTVPAVNLLDVMEHLYSFDIEGWSLARSRVNPNISLFSVYLVTNVIDSAVGFGSC